MLKGQLQHPRNTKGQKYGGNQRTITGAEALAIGQKLSSSLSSVVGKTATNYGTIDYSEIKNVINTNGKENYTFRITNHPESSETVFFNLVMTQREGYTTVMLMKYEMDPAFAEAYYTKGKDFTQFSGTVTTSLISSNDPCPPIVLPPVVVPYGGTPPDTTPDQGGSGFYGQPGIPRFLIISDNENDSGTGTTDTGIAPAAENNNGNSWEHRGSNYRIASNNGNDAEDPCPKNSTAGILSPEALQSFIKFKAALPDDMETWLYNDTNHLNSYVFHYLYDHNFDDDSKAFATEMIDYAYNNNSPEAIQEIINIMDIMNDGMVNGEYVVVSPNVPITNMSDYLSCFNTSQAATITIYADQPKIGTHNLYSYSGRVGHAFISIKQGTKVKTLGFYPISGTASIVPNPLTLKPNDFLSTPGIFGNDQGHPYDVSLSLPLTPTGLANVINSIVTVANSNPQYNIGSMNCTDLAISIFNSEAIMNIPNCESPSPWSGQTPGTLGEVIRDLDIPVGTGGVKNTNGGNAPNNNSN